MKTIYPESLEFSTSINWELNKGGVAKSNKGKLQFDLPVEFGGEGKATCPDEIFSASLGACLITTFLSLAPRMNVDLLDANIQVQLNVEFSKTRYRISMIHIQGDFFVSSKSQLKRAKQCLSLTKEYCHILHSMSQDISLEINLQVHAFLKNDE